MGDKVKVKLCNGEIVRFGNTKKIETDINYSIYVITSKFGTETHIRSNSILYISFDKNIVELEIY